MCVALLFCSKPIENVAEDKVGQTQRSAGDRTVYATVRQNSQTFRRATQSRRQHLSLSQTCTGDEVTVL